ncbi:aspartate kinase [bacterium]|nr:aspartate kinase [bacterium]
MAEPATLVLKFGGTSVRDAAARAAAIRRVAARAAAGRRLAIVVSALGRKGEPYATDTLIGLLTGAGEPVAPRELDLAMAAGEQIAAALFAHELTLAGLPAQAFTGPQAGVLTDGRAGEAEILRVEPARIAACLAAGRIAVVAGFQGADAAGEIRTLGRGGSDTSGVALGAALGAAEVEIYTDVPGVADADPRRVPAARYLAELPAAAMLAMAEEGSKVVHPRAVRAALPGATPLRVLSTFDEGEGTLIHHRPATGPLRPLALAQRERLVLLRAAGADLAALDPELLSAGAGRYLAPDDPALPARLARLAAAGTFAPPERGWATLSLVFSGPGAAAPPPADAEAIPAPADRCRWLVPEPALAAALAALHARLLRGA